MFCGFAQTLELLLHKEILSMGDEFAPLNLRARLAALQDKIAQARTNLEANGTTGDHAEVLTEFVDQHDMIAACSMAKAR